jgi:hypothetical protein
MYYKTKQIGQRKFKNIPQTYNGYSYDSKKEAHKAAELDLLVKGKEIKSWTRQDRIALKGENGTTVCHYKPDFTIYHNDGTIEILEIKSPATMTPVWRLKWKLLEDQLRNKPDMKLTVEV